MKMLAIAFVIWLLGVLGALTLAMFLIDGNPRDAPGGRTAVFILALLWPIVLSLMGIGVVLIGAAVLT